MVIFRILMLVIITMEISIITYAFAKKGKYSKTVNLFILYGVTNVSWFVVQVISTSPLINSENALAVLKLKAFFWNIPTLFYLFFILSLTKINIKKFLYPFIILELVAFIYTIMTNNVLVKIIETEGIFIAETTILGKIIPSLNIVPMLIIYFVLIKKYNKNIPYTKSYFTLFYLSFAMLLTIPVTHLIPGKLSINFIIPIWSFINSFVTFLVVKKLFLSIDYEEFTNELFRNIHDAVLITDQNNRIIVINQLANKIISERIGINLFLVEVSDIFENYDYNTVYKNKIFKLKNTEQEVMLSQSIMSNKISNFNSIIIIKDLQSEKLLQEELIKTQKLQSISVFIGGIAHDFGNILTAILGNTTYLKIKLGTDDSEVSTILKDNEKIILQAKHLTRQLLEYTKTDKSRNKKNIEISAIINSSVSLALSGSSISVKVDIAPNLENILGDKIQLEQVFNNLLINAKQAVKENGKITIKVKRILIENQYIQFIEPGKYLEIIIKDNGSGIEKNKLHKIFTPYFTTKSSGNGLGLAIVSSIIKNHGGYISVTSEINKGTTFTIYLPATSPPIKQDKETINTNIKKSQKEFFYNHENKKILIMDDEEMILKIAEKLLKLLKYEVILAKNGDEVLKYINNNPNEQISIYILDLTIPGGMGGKELAPKIKAISPNSKIVVSSGYSNKDEVVNYKDYSFDDKLVKPYTIEDLKSILRESKDEE